MPRLYTETPADVAGSYGGQAVAWAREALGIECRPWQAWALERALEYQADGQLRWPVVVLSVSRQSGKSVIGQVVCGWRQDQGSQVFGEQQTIVSTANKFATAIELWQAVAFKLQASRGTDVKWARGAEVLGSPAGNRWLVQAATANLGVGLSVSLALCDEAWNIDRDHVEGALVPTMLERASPQLWIVSTQGDSASDLLETYRQQGMMGLRDPDRAEVLLLEWSADPAADVTDRDAWQQASPHWSERRERFIERQLEILPDQVFRQQILNQRTEALAGWVTRGQWAACRDPIGFLAGPDAPKLIAACEFSEDGSLYALVITQQVAGRIVTRVMAEKTADGLWARVCELPQNALLLVSAGFKGRIPLAPCATRLVGVNEVRLATRPTLRAIQDQTIAHDGDPTLASHILTAVIAQAGEAGPVVSQRRSPGPITMARALCWCVGATLEIDAKPAPRVYSARA
jgi:phage terminase large subunit-like protein